MQHPESCENLAEIRNEIDKLDREILTLIGQRFTDVNAAAKFKTSTTDVKGSERFQAMLKQRKI